MVTKHQKRSRKTYRVEQSSKNYIFNKMAYRAELVLKSKLMRMEGGDI